ncbi:hypothetical protein [Tardiphaga sp.]|jgi:hypothetical protein|uniref:hypothetical protein n=1 Tax=Tardiphaga sp. TaxID=1926292 RepID=UPI0037DA0555
MAHSQDVGSDPKKQQGKPDDEGHRLPPDDPDTAMDDTDRNSDEVIRPQDKSDEGAER